MPCTTSGLDVQTSVHGASHLLFGTARTGNDIVVGYKNEDHESNGAANIFRLSTIHLWLGNRGSLTNLMSQMYLFEQICYRRTSEY
jgi:protocatechuate 3,4-dioxygenase beta subunit